LKIKNFETVMGRRLDQMRIGTRFEITAILARTIIAY
jgi:hypothetical protein